LFYCLDGAKDYIFPRTNLATSDSLFRSTTSGIPVIQRNRPSQTLNTQTEVLRNATLNKTRSLSSPTGLHGPLLIQMRLRHKLPVSALLLAFRVWILGQIAYSNRLLAHVPVKESAKLEVAYRRAIRSTLGLPESAPSAIRCAPGPFSTLQCSFNLWLSRASCHARLFSGVFLRGLDRGSCFHGS
jgi:hypothetical protein